MRKRLSPARQTAHRRRRREVGLALCLLLFWGLIRRADKRIQPTLKSLADYECRATTVRVMNQAIEAAIKADPAPYGQLYQIEHAPDGTARTVHADSAKMNTVRLALAGAVDEALRALPEQMVLIPYGSLTDIAFLNDLGPGWRLSLHPQGYVEGSIEESVEALSINRMRYQATLILQVTICMVLDGHSSTAVVTNEFPLASLIVSGDTPAYYSLES